MKSILLVFLAATTLHAGETVGYFRIAGVPDPTAATRRLDYIESKLGIQHHSFNHSIPRDKKLIVTFTAELDGKPLSNASGVYHIAPSTNPKITENQIHISACSPSYPLQAADKTIWDISSPTLTSSRLPLPVLHSTHKEAPRCAKTQSIVWNYPRIMSGGAMSFALTGRKVFVLLLLSEPIEAADELGRVRKGK